MAKRSKKKKNIDSEMIGNEAPIFIGEIASDDPRLHRAFAWYNHMYDQVKARTWTLEWMKKNGMEKKAIDAVRSAPKWKTVSTMGWMAKMMLEGTVFQSDAMKRFEDRLNFNIEAGRAEKKVAATRPKIDIHARTHAKAMAVVTNIEEQIDGFVNGEEFNLYEFLRANTISPQIASIVRTKFQPIFDEFDNANVEVREGYGNEFEKFKTFYKTMEADLERFVTNSKKVKVRKPRAKKMKTSIDLVEKMKYQEEDIALKIVSIHPTQIIGAEVLYTYNTKYRRLSKFIALDEQGFSVAGTTLKNVNLELAEEKTLRKPEEQLAQLMKAGKVATRKFMSTIKTKASNPNARINDKTILVKVIK